jgi:hypothetical protein
VHRSSSVEIFRTMDGKITEHSYLADVVACIFWLKNRRPCKWREQHHTGAVGVGS